MRWSTTLLVLVLAAPAAAQQSPGVSTTALDELIRRCIAAGGLNQARTKAGLSVGDPARLRATVVAQRAWLTESLRLELIVRSGKAGPDQAPPLVALLRAVGEAARDERALAYAALYEGDDHKRKQDAKAAIQAYGEAARRFATIKDPTWEADCYDLIGGLYVDQNEYDRAAESYTRCLDVRRAALGPRHPEVARALEGLGLVQQRRGDPDRALKHLQEALAIRRAVQGERQRDVARCLVWIASLQADRRQFDRALESFQQALEIRRQASGEMSTDVVFTLENIGLVHHRRGDPTRAQEAFERALAIRRQVQGERHLDVAGTLKGLALIQRARGDDRGARASLEEAMDIERAALGEQHPDVATTLADLGAIAAGQGEAARAIQYLEQSLTIQRQVFGERNIRVVVALVNLAPAYAARGEFGRALDCYRRALATVDEVEGRPSRNAVALLDLIATAYRQLGEPGRALTHLEQALASVRRMEGEQSPAVAEQLRSIAAVRGDLGDQAGAITTLEQALALAEAAPGERPIAVAAILHDLGSLRAEQGEFDRARTHLERALELRRVAIGEQHVDVALTLAAIAKVHSGRGEPAKASKALERALAIRRELQGKRHPAVIQTLKDLGILYARQGREGDALAMLDQALDALRDEPDDRQGPIVGMTAERLRALPLTVTVLQARAVVQQNALGEAPTAAALRQCLRVYERAADMLERLRRKDVETGPSKLQLGEQEAELFPRLVGLSGRLAEAEGRPEGRLAAFAAAERGTARVFLEALGRARAAAIGGIGQDRRTEEADLLADVRELDERIDREQARPVETRDGALIARLRAERRRGEERLQALIRRLERDYPRYAGIKYPRPCTLDEARACLADDEVALLYVLGSEASYLIVVPQDEAGALTIHRLPPADRIAEMVAALTHQTTLDDAERAREMGVEAYRVLLAPAAAAIRGKGLVIVPSRALGQLPFELLVEPTDGTTADADAGGRFLVEGHRLRYAPSLTVLHLAQRWETTRSRPERPLWAVGDPIYETTDPRLPAAVELAAQPREGPGRDGRDPDRGAGPAGRLSRLAFSGEEVARLGRLLGATADEVLVGPAATEAAVKQASASGRLARHHYVHFATHGLLDLGEGRQPGLVLSRVDAPGPEDGSLLLDEVTDMKLNADLVVLSACQTGRGRLYQAEGVVGLARAFLYAGSRGVLCSLWRVDDEATADLMVDVYTGLKAGQTAPEAMRAAQLKRIAAGEPPLFWAPFILIGE